MPYTPSDIGQLKTLAYHPDLSNVALALELLKGNGWDERLSTILYWMTFRFEWEQAVQAERETRALLRRYAPAVLRLPPLLEWIPLPIATIFKDHLPALQQCHISCEELAQAIHSFFLPQDTYQELMPFLFRFGTEAAQRLALPYLIRKQYTRVDLLDLSGYQFGELPAGLVAPDEVRELNLDGNQLQQLPDNWETWQALEVLHLTNNQLTVLPPSFGQIHQLKRLYIQNNPWEPTALTQILQQLPLLEYLSVAASTNDPLYPLEALVQEGLLQASKPEQQQFLAFELQDAAAFAELSLLQLFAGLQQEEAVVRELARQQLLASQVAQAKENCPTGRSIAILGLVSFAARKQLEQLAQRGWQVTNEIGKATTHIVLGDHPEQYEAVAERAFIFLSEQDVWTL